MATRRDGLAARREALGYTQEAFAQKLGVELSTVGRWERGTLTPQPWRRHKLAAALQVSLEQLDSFLGDSASVAEKRDNGRTERQLLPFDVGIDEAGTIRNPAKVVALPAGSTVPAAATPAEPILAASLLTTLEQYATTDNLTGSRWLLSVVPHQITFIEQLLADSRGRPHRQLLYVAARFAEFLGWLTQDAGDLREAMRWSRSALDFAQEAGDAHLMSYIQMRKSNIASDARKSDLALAFAHAALQNSRELTPRLRAVALRQEAHAHALAGNSDGCARALDHAVQHAAGTPDEEGDIACYCTPSYVEMEAAHCWVELGKPTRAITTLQQSLANWHPNFRRDLGLCLARLAVAYASDAQPDHAAAVAQHALTIAATTRSHRSVRELHRLPALFVAVGANDHAHQLRHELATCGDHC